jgi:hypothetical protein
MQKEKPDGRICLDERQRILLLGRPIGYIQKGAATVDDACHLLEVNRFLLPRCKSVRFVPGVAKKLEQDELMSKAHLIRRARIYQLKADVDPEMRFIGYERLMATQGGVNPDNYAVVFDGDVGSSDPETVYRMLRDSLQPGTAGVQTGSIHALALSDVLELYNPKESRFFYIDTFALKPVDFEAGVRQEMRLDMGLG